MRMSKWIGYAVSVNCGEPLGCYQGTILEADGSTITLTKAFRNGFPYPKSQVTLSAADIKDLKIIESKGEPPEQTHSTVAIPKKKTAKATVCENLQANPTNSDSVVPISNAGNGNKSSRSTGPSHGAGQSHSAGPARSKPIDIQSGRVNKNNNQSGSYGNSSTPKQRASHAAPHGAQNNAPHHAAFSARRRNEACFGDAAAPPPHDFDFEGNLALFDKQALWEEMKHSQKPDLVRHADEVGKFRHDENVLGPAPARSRVAVTVPDQLRLAADYVTDDGLVLPAVMPKLRQQFWQEMDRMGLVPSSVCLLARACADVCVRAGGGGRRLAPHNAHQRPRGAVLARAGHAAGAAALLAARLLRSHGVDVHVYCIDDSPRHPLASRELAALRLDGVEPCAGLAALPTADLVLLALHDPLENDTRAFTAEQEWSERQRACVVVLEPSPSWSMPSRAAIQAGLPGAACNAARLYLADVAPPQALLQALHVRYRTPFGAASVLPLHLADDHD